MGKKYVVISICALIFSFFFLTFGFCAFTNELTISDIGATVRRPLDVRITNLYLENASSGVESNNLDYNVQNIITDLSLPQNGTITYNVEFTNYTNYPVYLIGINNLPDNLKCEIDIAKENKYQLKSLFIQNQNEIKEITITISYKENGYDSTNEYYNLNLGFYFETSYNISYHSNYLPTEYQQVEYIESTGTQYIDTKVLAGNNNLKFELQHAMLRYSSDQNTEYIGVFGSYSSETANTTRMIYNKNGNSLAFINSIAGGSSLTSNVQRQINEVYTDIIERQGNTTTHISSAFEGTIEKTNVASGTAYSDNIAIFAQNTNGAIAAYMKLYYFKIYDSGKLIRYFLPCYRKSDGEIGLYDIVTKEFYTNIGKGTFVKGNDVSTTETQNILTGSTYALSKNKYTLSTHVFTGWNTEPDGSGTSYKDQQQVYNIGYNNENIDLYAQWRPYQSTIKFDANSGVGTMNSLITPYGGNQILTANTFVKGGYTFNGWNTEPDGSGTEYQNEKTINVDVSNGDKTIYLYAQWSKKIIPSEYQRVEYIESTGTQYINTKVLSDNDNLKFELKYSLTKLSAKNYTGIFGAYYSENANATRLIYRDVDGVGNAYAYINSKAGNGALVDRTSRTVNTVYTDIIEKKDSITMMTSTAFTGTIQITPPNGTSYSDNIAIFAQNIRGAIASSMRLYYFKIYNNDELIREFIPCYRKSDTKIGLYDIVTNQFYTNIGKGEFTKGYDA